MLFSNKKIIISFIVTVSIIVLILFNKNTQSNEQDTQNNLKKISNQIDHWLVLKKDLLINLAIKLGELEYKKEAHLPLMKEYNNKMQTNSIFSGFKDGQYFDTQGYWVKGFDPRIRPWYYETMNNQDITISGPMHYTDLIGQKVTWWGISSVIYKDKQAIGVISSEILSEMFEQFFKYSIPIRRKNVLLFNKNDGIIIYTHHKEYEYKRIQNISNKDILKLIKKSQDGIINYQFMGEKKRMYFYRLKQAPWILCEIKSK